MLDWRLAESLRRLREQINAACPDRDKTSDGAIGDAAHASRKSDHNPWIFDPISNKWVVSAIDIDKDLGKVKLQEIVDAICASRDERVKYIIWNGRITVKGSKLQRWKKYDGKNAHREHVHISVESSRKLYDNRSDWDLGIPMIQRVKDSQPATAVTVSEDRSETDRSESPQVIRPITNENTSAEFPTVPSVPAQTAASNDLPNHSPEPNAFKAYVPQIDSAKSWISRAFAGTTIGGVIAVLAGAPLWVQIGLGVLVLAIVIGAVIIIVKYHELIFGYITSMNTLRATAGIGNPIVAGAPPRLHGGTA